VSTSVPPLTVRAAPKAVRRFKRAALVAAASGVALLICGSLAVALAPLHAREEGPARELYNVDHVPKTEALAALPASYDELGPVAPRLGAPLPGDLGPAMLASQRDLAYPPPGGALRSADLEAERQARLEAVQVAKSARASGVFFQLSRHDGPTSGTAAPLAAAGRIDPLAPFGFTVPVAPIAQPAFGASASEDPNRQLRKLDFVGQKPDEDVTNLHSLQDPKSPYEVMAGSIIPASMVTGLNSDLPGTVIAQVTENVYDTATGRYLLIPQGARLVGAYDSVVAFGQDRALLVWRRIIFPDGSSIVIENMPASDESGYSGLEDKVDFHTWKLLQGVALSTVLGVGSELALQDDNHDNGADLVRALRETAQSAGDQAGQRIVNRALNVQPTITCDPAGRSACL
jgi:type IV secretion system protein VirB10